MSKNKNNQPIWSTRIKKNSTNLYKKIGGSLSIDKRLFNEDIEASIVHVEMLFKQKIISFKIKNKIVWGLNRIKNEIVKKKFVYDEKLEDIHMNIEKRLFHIIGEAAGYLHIARSRNDQVITDFKLWIKKASKEIRNKAKFNVKEIELIEDKTKHDFIAYIYNISSYIGESSKYFHHGITSSDVIDTSFSIQLKQSAEIIINELNKILKELLPHLFFVLLVNFLFWIFL